MHPTSDPFDGAARQASGADHTRFSATSLGLGAALMYFFDPDRGRRRRALLRDQLSHAARLAREAPRVTGRDLAGRSTGLWAELRGRVLSRAPSDEVLGERIRARLGRVVSHPHAIAVGVSDGRVWLGGPLLAQEMDRLLACVRSVPGVRAIENRLEIHAEAGNVPALQGGVPRRGYRFELLQDNWSPSARLISGGLGAALAVCGMRSGGVLGLASSLAGGALLLRAASNRDLKSLFGVGAQRRAIEVEKTIHIEAPPAEVFSFWSNYRNFPRFMSRVRELKQLDERRSHWVVAGPAGIPVSWTAEVTRLVPERLIEWRADGESAVRHWGAVHFEADRGGTRIQVQLHYIPPAGLIGHALAALVGADPKSDLDADLLRMKSMIETGRTPHDAAAGREALQAEPPPQATPVAPVF